MGVHLIYTVSAKTKYDQTCITVKFFLGILIKYTPTYGTISFISWRQKQRSVFSRYCFPTFVWLHFLGKIRQVVLKYSFLFALPNYSSFTIVKYTQGLLHLTWQILHNNYWFPYVEWALKGIISCAAKTQINSSPAYELFKRSTVAIDEEYGYWFPVIFNDYS